jgi:hypothetical protein
LKSERFLGFGYFEYIYFRVSNDCAAAEIRHRLNARFFAGFFAKAIPLRRGTMPVIQDS